MIRFLSAAALALAFTACNSRAEEQQAGPADDTAPQTDLTLTMLSDTAGGAPCAALGSLEVRVANSGPGDAGATQLSLTAGNAEPTLYEMPGLAAGETADLHPLAPANPPTGSFQVTVAVDPGNDVAETDESNNSFSFACPG